jgi:hypothetical protein
MSTQTTEMTESIDSTGRGLPEIPDVSGAVARAGGGEAFGFGPDGRPAGATAGAVGSAEELVDGPWLDAVLRCWRGSTSRGCS